MNWAIVADILLVRTATLLLHVHYSSRTANSTKDANGERRPLSVWRTH